MPKVSGARPDVDAVVADVLELVQAGAQRVPDWLTRELTIGQLKLLFLLGRDGPLSMGTIAKTFNVSLAAASGLVDRTEQQGLVAREHRSDDRRIVECFLTERGRRFIAELSGTRSDALRRSLSTLEPAELAEFHRLIRLIHSRQQGHSA